MIVPKYWSEAKEKIRINRRQVTLKRFGWSDSSLEDAQKMAEKRLMDSIVELRNNHPVKRFEKKVAYNGADGLPIREEIISKFGEVVVTRNSYGAKCLNVANILIADIDTQFKSPKQLIYFFLMASIALAIAGFIGNSNRIGFLGVGAFTACTFFVGLMTIVNKKKSSSHLIEKEVQKYCDQNPEYNLRLYKSPAGFRIIATHQNFDPRCAEVQNFFSFFNTDKLYALMCNRQNCFRARLTAKPWRIGLNEHLKPNSGVWPVDQKYMGQRDLWLRQYDQKARDYAAVAFVGEYGSRQYTREARMTVDLHDSMSRALSQAPLA